MIGHSKNVSKTKSVELAVGENIFLNRGRFTPDWTKYIIRLIHKTASKTVMYAQHISPTKNHLVIIDFLGKTYTTVDDDIMVASNLREVAYDSSGDSVTFNEDMLPCKMKRVSETEFTPVVVGDILHKFKDSKHYTVVAIAPDGTLFLTDTNGKASMVNPRDNTALTAFGLENA